VSISPTFSPAPADAGNRRSRVLVVEDEEDVRALIVTLLDRAGFEVSEAGDGRHALHTFYEVEPDLVVLDVAMPDLDGWDVLQRIRDLANTPVLMLTAQADESARVRGLGAGADDYLTKPFGRQELVARVRALLRRSGSQPRVAQLYGDDYLTIDFRARQVLVGDRPVQLTPLEFRLLAALVRHPGQVLSREQLLELAWSDPYAVSLDEVKLYVMYLRKKLAPADPRSTPIENIRGFGYRYRPEAARVSHTGAATTKQPIEVSGKAPQHRE
jgi:DNA-binding response OmpR family regulator